MEPLLAALTPSEKRKEKRVSRRLRWVLPIAIGIGFIAMSLIWSARIYSAQSRSVDERVESCKRGNVIRDYLSYDNNARVIRIDQQIHDHKLALRTGSALGTVLSADDLSQIRAELVYRHAKAESLQPFDCNSLR